MNRPEPSLSFPCPPELAAGIDAWIAARPEPRPSRAEAIRQLLAAALAHQGTAAAGVYRATRVGASRTVDEWRGEAPDDEGAAHRLGQRLKTRIEQGAEGYTPDDMVTLIRPDGEIVTVAHLKEMVERLTGWRTAPTADPSLDGEWGS